VLVVLCIHWVEAWSYGGTTILVVVWGVVRLKLLVKKNDKDSRNIFFNFFVLFQNIYIYIYIYIYIQICLYF
jgi:hypothetical protein